MSIPTLKNRFHSREHIAGCKFTETVTQVIESAAYFLLVRESAHRMKRSREIEQRHRLHLAKLWWIIYSPVSDKTKQKKEQPKIKSQATHEQRRIQPIRRETKQAKK